jgi:hypothetical protein
MQSQSLSRQFGHQISCPHSPPLLESKLKSQSLSGEIGRQMSYPPPQQPLKCKMKMQPFSTETDHQMTSHSPAPPLESKVAPRPVFPLLPSELQVLTLLSDAESDLAQTHFRCAKLLSACSTDGNPTDRHTFFPGHFGIIGFHGHIMNHSLFDRFRAESISRTNRSRSIALIPYETQWGDSEFHRCVLRECARFSDELAPAFSFVFSYKMSLQRKVEWLASQYLAVWEAWLIYCVAVDRYNIQTHRTVTVWGTEQPLAPTRKRVGFAEDVPMILDPRMRVAFASSVESALVTDSNKKSKLVWSEDEKEVFYIQLREHGKRFRKIGLYLPGKSTKGVIEFYYLHKFTPEMQEVLSSPQFAKQRSRKRTTLQIMPFRESMNDKDCS